MEHLLQHWRLAIATALIVARQPVVRAQSCNATSSSCSGFCTPSSTNPCSCDLNYSRCVCEDDGAALHSNGSCLFMPQLDAQSSNGSACTFSAEATSARVLVVIGTMQSPELQAEHVGFGESSAALKSILRLSTAAALDVDAGQVELLQPRLISWNGAVQLQGMPSSSDVPGLIFLDVEYRFCAYGVFALPGGADFERRLAVTAQGFLAFTPVSTIRLLELEYETEPGLGGGQESGNTVATGVSTEASIGQTPAGETSWLSIHPTRLSESLLILLASGMLLAFVGVVLGTFHLMRVRQRWRAIKMRQEEVVTPASVDATFVPAWPTSNTQSQSLEEGLVACVVQSFDVSDGSDADRALVRGAGLEPIECLQVAEGDLVAVIARGEGWLYGRILRASGGFSNSGPDSRIVDLVGTFGYVPEARVSWRSVQASMPTAQSATTGRESALAAPTI